MHVKKWKPVKMRPCSDETKMRRNQNLLRMSQHVPYFKLRTLINEFTPRVFEFHGTPMSSMEHSRTK